MKFRGQQALPNRPHKAMVCPTSRMDARATFGSAADWQSAPPRLSAARDVPAGTGDRLLSPVSQQLVLIAQRQATEGDGLSHLRFAEPVPDPGFGTNVLRLGGIVLNLLAEHPYVGSQVLEFIAVFGPPDGTQKFEVG